MEIVPLSAKSCSQKVQRTKTRKVVMVPTTPKSKILLMFSKNFFLYMLKPEAKTSGGKHT